MGKIYMIIGKSASGKDHIYQCLAQEPGRKFHTVIPYTTRPKRAEEENGREYYFSDMDHLQEFRQSGRIIEERVYETVAGPWYYFTPDDGQIRLEEQDYLLIGTLESYQSMRNYFGKDALCPIYIEAKDDIRLLRAIHREQKQKKPDYEEVCRRFLADSRDFSEENLAQAGIRRRFSNNGLLEECVREIIEELFGGK